MPNPVRKYSNRLFNLSRRLAWLGSSIVLAGILAFAGRDAYWHENQPRALPAYVTQTTRPASALIAESVRGQVRPVSENPPGIGDSRKRMDEISRASALSSAEPKRNDRSKELPRKQSGLPEKISIFFKVQTK
jgi:hypothetical protein